LPIPSSKHAISELSLMTENANVSLDDPKKVASQPPLASVNAIADQTPDESSQQLQHLQPQVIPENSQKSDPTSQPISLSNNN
jgi:hypothetical protein